MNLIAQVRPWTGTEESLARALADLDRQRTQKEIEDQHYVDIGMVRDERDSFRSQLAAREQEITNLKELINELQQRKR